MNSGSDTNFLRSELAKSLDLTPLFPGRGAVGINQQPVVTHDVYHELIFIRNVRGVLRELREPLTTAEIESDMILGVAWLNQRDPIISFSQGTVI